MNGQLLHLAELVIIAKLHLRKGIQAETTMGAIIGSHRFQFLKSRGFFGKACTKESIREWLGEMEKRGLSDICISGPISRSDLNTLAFSGSVGDCVIECDYGARTTLWQAEWGFDRGRTLWHTRHTERETRSFQKRIPDDPTERFGITLREIGAFAEEIGNGHFNEGFFHKSLAIMEGSAPTYSPFPDMPEACHRLFDATQSAWVFGGMGSWNDSAPYDAEGRGLTEKYKRLSGELYSGIMTTLLYAVNGW